MVNGGGAGPVTLRVEFAGLCLYMIGDPDANAADPNARSTGRAREFAVLMPDARKRQNPIHVDGTRGDAHVGYVRFDLANLDPNVDPGVVEDDVGRPRNEIIHRLDSETIDFGLGQGAVDYDLAVPSFNKFADLLNPIADLADERVQPPANLLMRTFLNDGEIRATGSGKIWKLPPVLDDRDVRYANQFGGYAVWNRQLNGANLNVTFRKFDGTRVTRIPLVAREVRSLDGNVRKMITIKICNLCAHNPLEWRDDYPPRTVGAQDKDFKWLYRLLEPRQDAGGDYAALLRGRELPFPEQIAVQAFGDEDCMGGSITK